MFTSSRYIVIDDEPLHLEGIVDGLSALGHPPLAIDYQPGVVLDAEHFRGVRGLFLDLQLVDSVAPSEFERHFAILQGLLESNISRDGGPYVLILWTDADEKAEAFEDYLVRNVPPELAHCLPTAVVPLSKTDYIEIDTGKVSNPEDLKEAIRARIEGTPAFAALMEWEVGVLSAAGRVMADLVGMSGGATLDDRGEALAQTIRRLANASVGELNAERDVRSATYGALGPLLSDHLANLPPDSPKRFQSAYEAGASVVDPMPSSDVAWLNTKLHIVGDVPKETIPTDWGVASGLGPGFNWERCGLEGRQYFLERVIGTGGGGYGISAPGDLKDVTLVQIRVGASCDYAQKADGPVSFVLGAIFPEGHKPLKNPSNSVNWLSPTILIEEHQVRLVVNPRIQYTLSRRVAANLNPRFRVREQLLMELISHLGHHGARPGIIRFP